MKIIIDAINDNEQIRGPDRYLISLLRGLARIDIDNQFVVFYAHWQTFFDELDLPSNFRFIRVTPPRHRIPRVIWHAIWFYRLTLAQQPDIIHLPNIIYVRGLNKPTLMTVHDVAHFTHPEKFGLFRGYLQRWLIHGAVHQVDHLLAVSDHTKDQIQHYLSVVSERITVVEEGGPEPLDIVHTEPTKYFLYVGQIEHSKNIESAILAFAQSKQLHDQEVEFWLAGRPGNAAPQVTKLINSLKNPHIRLLGYVDESKLPSLYANALGFVFPSLVEGFGLVLLEAMAYGTPIIASSASVIPQVVGDAGIIVDATNLDALQQALESVESDTALRASLIKSGRERLKNFSWEQAAHLTNNLYHKLADE